MVLVKMLSKAIKSAQDVVSAVEGEMGGSSGHDGRVQEIGARDGDVNDLHSLSTFHTCRQVASYQLASRSHHHGLRPTAWLSTLQHRRCGDIEQGRCVARWDFHCVP